MRSLLCLLVICACSEAPHDPAGTYSITETVTSGNCGPLINVFTLADAGNNWTITDAGGYQYTGSVLQEADRSIVRAERVGDDGTFRETVIWDLTIDDRYRVTGTGSYAVVDYDGIDPDWSCSSSYSITGEQQQNF